MFDVCVVCFAELRNDARTLNIAGAMAGSGLSTLVAGFGSEGETPGDRPFGTRLLKKTAGRHSYTVLAGFLKDIFSARAGMKAGIYWAADLYSLAACRLLAACSGGSIVYDSREIYSALGPLEGQRMKQLGIMAMEKFLVRKVSEFVVSGPLDAEHLKKSFGSGRPFSVVLNVPPFRSPVKSSLLRDRFGIAPGKKIVLYQGAVLDGRGIGPVMKAIAPCGEFVFCIMGGGPKLEKYKAMADSLGLGEKVFFTGSIPYGELHDWTCSADIGVAFIEPVSYSYELALPNKLFEYMMAGLPILASSLPAMQAIRGEVPFGMTVEPGAAPEEIASALRAIASDGKYEEYRRSCLEASREFCFERQAETVMEIISRVAGK